MTTPTVPRSIKLRKVHESVNAKNELARLSNEYAKGAALVVISKTEEPVVFDTTPKFSAMSKEESKREYQGLVMQLNSKGATLSMPAELSKKVKQNQITFFFRELNLKPQEIKMIQEAHLSQSNMCFTVRPVERFLRVNKFIF
jgi:hypothetical protein